MTDTPTDERLLYLNEGVTISNGYAGHLLVSDVTTGLAVSVDIGVAAVLCRAADGLTAEAVATALAGDGVPSDGRELGELVSRGILTERRPSSEAQTNRHVPSLRMVNIEVEHQHVLLRDLARVMAYRRALEQVVQPRSVVLDVGCGSGLLSMQACLAGARKCYAVEYKVDTANLARELVRANGMHDRIEVFQALSTSLPSELLDPRPDVVVSELLGNGILDERVLEFTIDARDRLAEVGATLVPRAIEIWVCGVDTGVREPRDREVDALEEVHQLDLRPLKLALRKRILRRFERLNVHVGGVVTDDVQAAFINLETIREPTVTAHIELTARRDGYLTAACAYFKAHLGAAVVLTNSPWAPANHWVQLIHELPEPLPIRAGEKCAWKLAYRNGELRLRPSDE